MIYKFWKYLSVLAVLSMLFSYMPVPTSAQEPVTSTRNNYLPLVTNNWSPPPPPVVTFKVGSFTLGAVQAASEVNCDFDFAPQGEAAAAARNSICPIPGTYAGLTIETNNVQQKLAMGYQDAQQQVLVSVGAGTQVSAIETYENPYQLIMNSSLMMTPTGGINVSQRVKVVSFTRVPEYEADATAATPMQGAAQGLDMFFTNKVDDYIIRHGGINLKLAVPALVPFFSRRYMAKLTTQCGTPVNEGEEWYPVNVTMFFNPTLGIKGITAIGGVFTGPSRVPGFSSMHECMSPHTFLLSSTLRNAEWAGALQAEVRSRVGDWNAPPFKIWEPNWDPSLVYDATWRAFESGLVMYIIYESVKNGAAKATNVFFIVPEQLLTCPMLNGKTHCVVAEPQAAQMILQDLMQN